MLGFLAGMGAGALLGAIFGVMVIYLGTNQYATGLALSLFGVGFSAFVGIAYVQEKLPPRPQFEIPFLADIPLLGSAFFKTTPAGLRGHRFCFGTDLVFVQNAHRFGAAFGR
jgi:simple sugar transport system permease protein